MSLDEVTALHLVENTEDAMACLRWLSTRDRIGFDTEGTGLKPETDRVRLVQIGDRHEGWAIPYEINQMLVQDIVKRFEGQYVMFNAPYDVAMTRSSGIQLPVERIEDTRLKAHVLSSTGPLALKPLAAQHVDPGAAGLQDDLKSVFAQHGWNWATIPWNFRQYWQYGALDPVLTMQLDDALDPVVRRVSPKSYDLEMAAAWSCEKMMRNGAAVDRPYVTGFLADLEGQVAELLAACRSAYGINPGSSDQVADALVRDGVQMRHLTSGGRFKTDKNVLGAIDHPLARLVLEYRTTTRLANTYLASYLPLSERDGRIHPSINTVGGIAKNPFENGGEAGVRTGRMSASDPNVQNVPMRTEQGKLIRRSFTARCSDRCGCGGPHTWVKCDFDQIEQRVMAHMSGDRGMREAFLGPDDFFVALGRRLYNDPTMQKSDPRRTPVKNAAYGKIYGAGPDKFALMTGMLLDSGEPDVAQAQAFLKSMDDMYPGPQRFTKAVIRQGNKRFREEGAAYVRSPLTGRRVVAERGRFYALVNYIIQMMAGEILKMKIVEADAAGLGQYMVMPVHDEIDLDVPTADLPEVVATLHEVFNDSDLLTVPVTASVETGPNWGEVKEWQE